MAERERVIPLRGGFDLILSSVRLLFALHLSTIAFRLPAVFLLDSIFGEIPAISSFHPVVLMGRLVRALEGALRRVFRCPPCSSRIVRERVSGAVLAVSVSAVSFIVPAAVLLSAFIVGTRAGSLPLLVILLLLDVFWGYQSVAARCLRDEAENVRRAVSSSVGEGRSAVSRIVGRDTACLDKSGVVRACVETVAENTTDGVFAPLLFYALGGAPLALFYKAVNTMDSMIAYKNERYAFFGTFAARMDDAANFVPARIAALFMIVSSVPFRFFGTARAVRIFFRDRYRHASPNSAQTESVIAGLLGVRLAGDASYEGKVERKPFIGDDVRAVVPHDITLAVVSMYASSSLFCAALSALSFFLEFRR